MITIAIILLSLTVGATAIKWFLNTRKKKTQIKVEEDHNDRILKRYNDYNDMLFMQ